MKTHLLILKSSTTMNNSTHIRVGTKDFVTSNNFLNSLWRELAIAYLPSHAKENKCPWLYMPERVQLRNKSILKFGSVETSLGNLNVSIEFKKKGDIDNIIFCSLSMNEKDTYDKIAPIVTLAIDNMNNLDVFTAKSQLIFDNSSKFKLHNYSNQLYSIYSNKNGTYIEFLVYARGISEANHIQFEILDMICHFVALETNLYVYWRSAYNLISGSHLKRIEDSLCFSKYNFIFGNSFYKEYIALSENGINFIESYILNSSKFYTIDNSPEVRALKNASRHFSQALFCLRTLYSSSKKYSPHQRTNHDKALVDIISSLESLSFLKQEPETCEKCGAKKYRIRQSLSELIQEYSFELMGKVYKQLYDRRSSYLHTGSTNFYGPLAHINPVLDSKSKILVPFSRGVSLHIDGMTYFWTLEHISDIAGFAIRNWYGQEIFNNKLETKERLPTD